MRAVCLRAALAAVAFVACHAHAGLETRDSRFGDDTLILDTETGLEWLRLDVTRGLSYDYVYNQLDTTFLGFRFAESEVRDLLHEIGIVHEITATIEPLHGTVDAQRSFLEMFGAVHDASGLTYLRGFPYFGPSTPRDPVTGQPLEIFSILPIVAYLRTDRAVYYDDSVFFYKPVAYPEIGSFLVATAPVPEPATYALVLSGLAALGLARRRARR